MRMAPSKKGLACAALLTPALLSLRATAGEANPPFFAQLLLQGVTFQVESPNAGPVNRVTVRAVSAAGLFAEESMEADGSVSGVEVEDLNADGYPEVYVYVTSAGSGSYGSLIAYGSNRNRSISQIYLPPLADDPQAAEGYMGHDRFAVGEGSLLRRFPVYLQGDANAAPTGGTRQVQYRLKAGEAGWQLVPYELVHF